MIFFSYRSCDPAISGRHALLKDGTRAKSRRQRPFRFRGGVATEAPPDTTLACLQQQFGNEQRFKRGAEVGLSLRDPCPSAGNGCHPVATRPHPTTLPGWPKHAFYTDTAVIPRFLSQPRAVER